MFLKLGLALFISVLLSSCGGGPERLTYIGGTGYFPLRDGRVLRYRETENGNSTEYTVRFRYVGGRAHKLFSTTITGIKYGGLEFRSNGNIIQAAMQASPTSLFSRKNMGEFRQVWVNEDVAPDSSWVDEDTGTETFVLDYQKIIVPAGTFEDCYGTEVAAIPELEDSLKARRDRGDIDNDQFHDELAAAQFSTFRWFASGVGLVREQIGENLVRELISVDSVGDGIPDTLPQETSTQVIP